MKSNFDRLAGYAGILAGAAGFLYALSFVVLKNNLLSATFLLLGGLLASMALTGLYGRLRDSDPNFLFWAFLLAFGGALGSVVHGGFDLSNALHPPATLNLDLPNPVDPRGLLTFGLAGLGLFVLSWLALQSGKFAKNFAYLGYLSAVLMIVLYLGRLVILDAKSLVIGVPALLEGFIVNPIWNIWLGIQLMRER